MREVRYLGEELLATKGVLHGDVRCTSSEGSFNRWHKGLAEGLQSGETCDKK